MELYNKVAYAVSRLVTLDYSTSFGSSTKLFAKEIQPHIYAIYGLVRVADEVVDTYKGKDREDVLNALEQDVYTALKRGYSTNPIIQSFVLTANEYGISRTLIHPFFVSMLMDVKPVEYTQKLYETYIYGSAEVIGLMCLKVFVNGDDAQYTRLEKGARALGSAYQKVNFLRDMAADYKELGRVYFPGVTFDGFDDATKNKIIKDIERDFSAAKKAVARLPQSSQRAVGLSIVYYGALLEKLKKTPADVIKQKRVRINDFKKALLLTKAAAVKNTKYAA